jgi:drug/metabolite transporter (DMT)-like permease
VQWLVAMAGVLGVSASGPLMAASVVPALSIAFWRNAMAAALLVPTAAATRRGELAALNRRQLRVLAVSSVALAAHFATWVMSLKMTSVASATALVGLMAGWVVLLSWWRGEVIHRLVLTGLVLSFAGVLLISGVDTGLSTRALIGDLLALAGGLFAAIYTVAGAEARRTLSTTTYTTVCYSGCAAVLLVVCLVADQPLSGFGASGWWSLVAVTVCAQLLGHSAFNHLLATMSPTVVSLIILLEVPMAAMLAACSWRRRRRSASMSGLCSSSAVSRSWSVPPALRPSQCWWTEEYVPDGNLDAGRGPPMV